MRSPPKANLGIISAGNFPYICCHIRFSLENPGQSTTVFAERSGAKIGEELSSRSNIADGT